MKKPFSLIRIYLLILSFVTCHSLLRATHSMGPELMVKKIAGSNNYLVTLNIYRTCGGSAPASSYNVSKGACGGSLTVNRVSTTDITPLCPSAVSKCSSPSGNFGVELHVYTGTFNLSSGCGSTTLSFSDCCRESGISSLSNPGSQSMYVGCLLTNNISNSSPVWLNPPVLTLPVNKAAHFNAAASDPDGDALVYSLTACRQGATTDVTYASGYSGTSPLTTQGGVSINSSTGAISLTPTAVETGVICIRAEEYRGGSKIGEITRDVVIRVISSGNNPPAVSGVNGGSSYSATVTAGSNLTFMLNGSDADGEAVNMDWNHGITGPSVSFTNNNTTAPVATFSWTPSTANIGTHVFTLNVKDNACDINAVSQYTYQVTVNAPKLQAADPGAEGNFLQCHPQPFTGTFTAAGFLEGAEGPVKITLVDLTGRKTASFDCLAVAGYFSAGHDLSEIPAGVYVAVAECGKLKTAVRVLKQ